MIDNKELYRECQLTNKVNINVALNHLERIIELINEHVDEENHDEFERELKYLATYFVKQPNSKKVKSLETWLVQFIGEEFNAKVGTVFIDLLEDKSLNLVCTNLKIIGIVNIPKGHEQYNKYFNLRKESAYVNSKFKPIKYLFTYPKYKNFYSQIKDHKPINLKTEVCLFKKRKSESLILTIEEETNEPILVFNQDWFEKMCNGVENVQYLVDKDYKFSPLVMKGEVQGLKCTSYLMPFKNTDDYKEEYKERNKGA